MDLNEDANGCENELTVTALEYYKTYIFGVR